MYFKEKFVKDIDRIGAIIEIQIEYNPILTQLFINKDVIFC